MVSKSSVVLGLAAVCFPLAAIGAPIPEEIHTCGTFKGPFISTFEQGPGCVDSPVQMCTHGTLRGDLPGTYEFTFLTFEPTDDPNVFFYTGQSVITLDTGEQIYGSDAGTFVIDPATGASFTTTVAVIDGTNFYTDVSGQFVATGSLPNGAAEARGRYTAEICVTCSPSGGSADARLCRHFDN
jgi:hypothetical protein